MLLEHIRRDETQGSGKPLLYTAPYSKLSIVVSLVFPLSFSSSSSLSPSLHNPLPHSFHVLYTSFPRSLLLLISPPSPPPSPPFQPRQLPRVLQRHSGVPPRTLGRAKRGYRHVEGRSREALPIQQPGVLPGDSQGATGAGRREGRREGGREGRRGG